MRKLTVKLRFYFWRTVIDQLAWMGLFGSALHVRGVLGFAQALSDALDCGWLTAPQAADKSIAMPSEEEHWK